MPLTPISGLHALQHRCRQAASTCAQEVGSQSATPRDRHEARELMEGYMAQADAFENHIKSNEELIQNIEHLIHYLDHSPIKSAHRSLAHRKLEEASGHLRRECGSSIQEIEAATV